MQKAKSTINISCDQCKKRNRPSILAVTSAKHEIESALAAAPCGVEMTKALWLQRRAVWRRFGVTLELLRSYIGATFATASRRPLIAHVTANNDGRFRVFHRSQLKIIVDLAFFKGRT